MRTAKAEAPKPVLRSDVAIGELVWFADRRHGRCTENIARITAINPDGTVALTTTIQGVLELTPAVSEWKRDEKTIMGWWKAKR